MLISNFLFCKNNNQNLPLFKGKTDDFWRSFNKKNKYCSLNDIVKISISNEENFLGEGFSKKGYKINGIDDYIIRIYKNNFQDSDLEKQFVKPNRSFLSIVEGVVLSIPNKIDIVIKKFGKPLGVEKYGLKIAPPLTNISVNRNETLASLSIYEQLKDFPLESFKAAYKQMVQFSRKNGYQFDIVNPNNIFIDTERKEINFIDPLNPVLSKCVDKPIKFANYHGRNSIYPILCDFIMQNEHINNLNSQEKIRWENAIKIIISKCIIAGKELGHPKNNENMEFLYSRINRIHNVRMVERFIEFEKKYSKTIKNAEIVADAVNHKTNESLRINAIKKLDGDFSSLKPIFDYIILAPYQPKVEIPEILNAVLDKLMDFNNVKDIIPTLETLFPKEIFYPTKKRLYNLFLILEPENKTFLNEIQKTINNPVEKDLYASEIKKFKKINSKIKKIDKNFLNKISSATNNGEIPKDLVDKLWMSRTCVNINPNQEISINNMIEAYKYIDSLDKKTPKLENLAEYHKIILKGISNKEKIAGLLRTNENNYLFNQIFNIKKIPKNAVNPYADSNDVAEELKKLNDYMLKNLEMKNPFKLASEMFFKLIWIHPFYDGNGRTIRLFVEQLLLSKGFKLNKWPEVALYRKIIDSDCLAKELKKNCTKLHQIL